jgi:benzoyl-CoA reductase/2-hydroxyglutaryl-CoA dehydratase subunit BcrC/BadD/HgdB
MQNVSVDNEAMAKYMSTDDVTCTASAIQNRVKKLKAMAKEENGGGYVLP